jgi:G3E family GTPase
VITSVTLVTGATAASREAAIAVVLEPGQPAALILEGLPSGNTMLEQAPDLDIVRIAPGCPCCVGNLTMRVTLNRMLRRHPARLYIGLASTDHLDNIRRFLAAPPYDALLRLTQVLHA